MLMVLLVLSFSLQILTVAVQNIVESIISVHSEDLSLLSEFFTLLMPGQTEWTRIRQALPPQVSKPIRLYRKVQAPPPPSVKIL